MALNIKDPETEKLARQVAKARDVTITQAVKDALADAMKRACMHKKESDREAFVQRILDIGREYAALPVYDTRTPDEMLYDENGIPK